MIIKKRYFLIMAILLPYLILEIICNIHSDLVDEVMALKTPKAFEMFEVGPTVERYINKGTTKSEAINILREQGFKVIDTKASRYSPVYDHCDEDMIAGIYEIYEPPIPIRDYKVTVRLCFKHERISDVYAWYLKHVY